MAQKLGKRQQEIFNAIPETGEIKLVLLVSKTAKIRRSVYSPTDYYDSASVRKILHRLEELQLIKVEGLGTTAAKVY